MNLVGNKLSEMGKMSVMSALVAPIQAFLTKNKTTPGRGPK